MQAHGRSYEYYNSDLSHTHAYLSPSIGAIISSRTWPKAARALDFGCGNGSLASWLSGKGFDAVGVDISESGISIAKRTYSSIPFSTDTSKENLAKLGPFDLVLCVEVIAHCYDPFAEMEKLWESLRPGGVLILSTPYHGYLKNLALAVTGHMDRHFSTLWSGSCVRFFSIKTISELLFSAKFRKIQVVRVGRIPPLAKSMVVSALKPSEFNVYV
jgi:2-polyprenyl-3-methyl-5-hydroxy-6-metoxy-1,4-benzoquinol methylase